MDGVKISVNQEEGEVPQKKKGGRPRKAATRAESVESRSESNDAPASERRPKKKEKGGFFSTLITMVVTAIVVGGAIYAWQKNSSKDSINNLSEEARRARMDLEQRLTQVKDKLSGVETENQKLKDTTKELEEYANLLKGAKLEFTDKELGISFEYPAVLGEAKVEKVAGAKGFQIKGSFAKNQKLLFGGISADYAAAASTTALDIMINQGYLEKESKFYFQKEGKLDATDYAFVPTKKISDRAVLLDKKSFAAAEGAAPAIDLGENVAVLINTGSDKFHGLAFVDQDLGQMPIENLEALAKSVQKN